MNNQPFRLPRLGGITVLCALLCALLRFGAAAQSPDKAGQWSGVQAWPIVAVHAHLLPNGKVLFYPYSDDAFLWNPTANTTDRMPKVGYNIFCSGHSFLPDGRLLVTGGHIENGWGVRYASLFDPFTNTWKHLPDMNDGRWYPTNTTLGNGEALVVSGSSDIHYTNNSLPQVWNGDKWRNLTSAVMGLNLYPAMHLAPNGKVFLAGPSQTTRYLNAAGTGAWTTVANRNFPYRGYGSSVLYDNGKVLYAGGGDPPTNTAEVIDLDAAAPAWRNVNPMSIARRQINATLIADGKVLVTGGSSAPGFDNADGAVRFGEIWDPATETWTKTPRYAHYRGYHSTALLLPDGRVLSAGGNGYPDAELYSPPYLFKGERPALRSAPASVRYGQRFFAGTPDGEKIARVHWIRLTSVTHATNMDQRINRLRFTQTTGGLQITAPSDANLSPPGYYMLFLLNERGVPSVAKIVRIGAAPSVFSVKVNFQPNSSDTPRGYLKDGGAVYGARGDGQTYGWNADNRANARDRNASNSPDQRYDTLNHMQKPSNPNAKWEIALPNGTYAVRVVAGDPSYYDSVYKINVEGTRAINATPTKETRWFDHTVTVTVRDGRLTVSNAEGAANNKICFLEISGR